jgi:hypothetical protein
LTAGTVIGSLPGSSACFGGSGILVAAATATAPRAFLREPDDLLREPLGHRRFVHPFRHDAGDDHRHHDERHVAEHRHAERAANSLVLLLERKMHLGRTDPLGADGQVPQGC